MHRATSEGLQTKDDWLDDTGNTVFGGILLRGQDIGIVWV